MPDLRIERVVVTGGRGFTDMERIETDLRALLPLGLQRVAQGGNGLEQFEGSERPATIVSADAIAWLVSGELQLEVTSYRVNRAPGFLGERNGVDGKDRRAPLRRNIRMLEAERPDLVLAYPDPESRGTWHCVREALSRGHVVAVWCGPGVRGPEVRSLRPLAAMVGELPRIVLIRDKHLAGAASRIAEVLRA